MRTSIIGAAAIALLSTTALVSAQQGPGGGGQPAMKEQGATPGGGSGGAERSQTQGGNQSTPERKEQPRAQAPDNKGASEKGDRTAEPKEKAGDTKRSAEPKDKAGDRNRAADKDRMDRDRSKDTARDRDQDRQRDQAQGKDGQRDGARANLSQDQRTQVRTRLSSHREARVTNVNFSINIGTRVPRDFRAVHVIPTDIVAIVPQYRGYRYFIYEERVVIVHPQRYEIVEVIDVDGGPRRGGAVTATLSLVPAQRTLIVQRIPNDHVARGVNIDLALGAELPSTVELYEFPEEILVEVPSLKPYRYVVLERRVAVVDPSNRAVVEVLDR